MLTSVVVLCAAFLKSRSSNPLLLTGSRWERCQIGQFLSSLVMLKGADRDGHKWKSRLELAQ